MIDAPVKEIKTKDVKNKEVKTKEKKSRAKKEDIETLSLEERAEVRSQLLSDVEVFLGNGGKVTQVDNNVRADPPRKPSMSYGSAPI